VRSFEIFTFVERNKSRRDLFRMGRGSPPPKDFEVLRLGRPAMGTRFEILMPTRHRRLVEHAHRALDEIRRLEELMTFFKPTSRISEINRDAFERPVVVEPELFELLRRGCELGRETDGALDVAAGALWRCWGFHRRLGRVPAAEDVREALDRSGARHIACDPATLSVRFRKPGLEVNLGSLGKGFALDRAAAILQNAGLGEALVHAGNSSFVAWGNPASDGQGWRISVRHPIRHGSDCLFLRLRDMGMGTSGIGEQYFDIGGRRYGHILDPRDGLPAARYLSVTVAAREATLADALSTAFFSMSPDRIQALCERYPDVGAVAIPTPNASEPFPENTPLDALRFGALDRSLERVALD
jgi:FAD:protein FMN transferase